MATDSTNKSTALTALNEYRLLGNSGLRISPLCLGCMTFGDDWEVGNNKVESKKIFDLYRSKGGNFYDTANVYTNGTSEKFLGEFISGFRSEAVVATKFTANPLFSVKSKGKLPEGTLINPNGGGHSKKSMVENLDASLKRLGTNYVDIFYVHCWEFKVPAEEVIRNLDDCVRSGKALYVAVSDSPAWIISKANTVASLRGWSPFIGLQTRYNLLDRSMESELGPMADEFNLGIIPWGVLAEGFLTGKHQKDAPEAASGRKESNVRHFSKERNVAILEEVKKIAAEIGRTPAQVTLNWTLQKPVTSPLVGAKTVQQLQDNLGALDFTLTAEQMSRLNTISVPEPAFPMSMIGNVSFFTDAGGKVKENRRNVWFK